MIKLIRHLKPYTASVVITILLLFVQANADLALPDYLSRIINVGIQQGGLESAEPQVLRQATFERALIFLDSAGQEQARQAYRLVEPGSPDYRQLQTAYPALAGEPVYARQDPAPAGEDGATPALARGLAALSFLSQAAADPQKVQAFGQAMGFDISRLPKGADLFQLLAGLPPQARAAMQAGISQRLDALGAPTVNQMAIAAVKAEYEALGVDPLRSQTRYILRVGGIMLLIALASAAITIVVGFLSSRVAAGLGRDLRDAVFRRVTAFSSAEIAHFSTASLITRSTNDITQIQMVTMILMRMVFFAPIIGIGGIIRAVSKAASMWWILGLMVVLLIGMVAGSFGLAMPRFKRIQRMVDGLNRVMRENLEGMMVVRAFDRQDHEEARFDEVNQDLTRTMRFIGRLMSSLMPTMLFLSSAVSLLVVWVGARQVAASTIQVGDMIAFMQYTMQVFFAFMMMSMMFIMLPRASVSADRIAEVLETEPTIHDPLEPQHFPRPFRGVIEFRQACFRYPDAEENVLEDITLTARPGETTAFIGTTGSGKSTIVNLIPRFYDVTCGAITIDGVDIRQVPQQELRRMIGYVPQQSNLFTGTIDSNLRLGDEQATPEELALAAGIAQAAAFIENRPEGYQAPVSQGGTNVSGGERQRLAIARALVKKAPIYIFDDSFSALDFKTDSALRTALKESLASSTVLIVTQRVATIKNAEQIIVLDEGRIVGRGRHAELMETCEVYRDIALSQLSQEELR